MLHGCVDNVRRTRLMCEVISCDKRAKADFTSVKHFRHFFLNRNMGCSCYFFFGERRMNVASSWTPPTKGRLFELRQDHHYPAIIILPVFFLRAWVSVSLVLRRSLLIRSPCEVSVTSPLKVESRNDRAENGLGLGWVSVLSWI